MRPDRQVVTASERSARLFIAALAAAGCAIAVYLTLFQAGAIPHVWDPIFRQGSELVLQSSVSRAIRRWTFVPDSLLGAAAYASELLLALLMSTRLGGERHWLIVLFELDSLALAAASLFLVVMQAFVIHAWCFLCLASAALSFAIVSIVAGRRIRRAA